MNISRSLSTELDINLVSQFFLLPSTPAYLKSKEIGVLEFGPPVSHVLQDKPEQVDGFLLQVPISGKDHGLFDGVLREERQHCKDTIVRIMGCLKGPTEKRGNIVKTPS